MLSSLHIQVAHKLVGLSPASFFEHATGLSRMTYQRGRGVAALAASRELVDAHVDSLLLRMMRNRGVAATQLQELKANIPSGISAQMVYGMGFLGEGCAPATRELVEQFDASDLRLRRLPDTEVAGYIKELGHGSALGRDYCVRLDVSGFRCEPLELSDPWREVLERVLTRRAHMALSFLAAVDHEMGRWSGRVTGFDRMHGRPRFAVLLANPAQTLSARSIPRDPIARLVEFVGAAGYRVRTGDWPEAAPTLVEMGKLAELSGAVAGDGPRFIRSLRSGKHPMTRSAFRTLIRSQLWKANTPASLLDDAADLMEPYLVAAHLLTLLIPEHPQAKGHLDRAGWRDAYLGWWARHAGRYPPPAPSVGAEPPDWLINP